MGYTRIMTDVELLAEIEPTIEQAFDGHMITANKNGRPFYPPTVLARVAETDRDPYQYGQVLKDSYDEHIESFADTYGVDVRTVLAASFLVNLLTEDNLPAYTSRIQALSAASPALIEFSKEWTAEEDAHGVLMRDYALLTGMIGDDGIISHEDYEAGRISQLREGTEINPPSLFHGFAYLTLQEHLTKEAHNKLGWLLDKKGKAVMSPIAGDEQNHYEFYRRLNKATLDHKPDETLKAMRDVYQGFDMPGRLGIPNFDTHAATISLAGIFDLETITKSQQTIVKKIDIEAAEPVTDEGKEAQEQIIDITSDRSVMASRQVMERLRSGMSDTTNDGLAPFVLGKTIDFSTIETVVGPRITGLQAIAA